MKKLIFMGILRLFILGSCNSKSGGNCEGHDRGTEAYSHDREGEDHNHEDEDHEGHDHEGEEHSQGTEPAAGHDDETILPEVKAEVTGVRTGVITPRAFEQVIKTSGQVLAAQRDESVAVTTVAGIVSFHGKVTGGMSVGKGTILVTISSSSIADGDPVQRAHAAYEISEKKYEHMQAFVKNKIVSDKEFTQVEQNYENAHISYEALAKSHSASGQAVVSPTSGLIKNILMKEGDYVTIGQPLVSVTQNRRLFLRAKVSRKYYPSLYTIGSANFKTPYDNRVYELEGLSDRLLSFGKSAGDNSFYVPATFEFDNRGDTILGSFVEVYLLSSPMENVISLLHTVLTGGRGLFFVYLQLDEKGYKKQGVTLGADNGKNVQILSGVKTGDRVVTQGVYQIELASVSSTIPARSHKH